MFRILQRMYSHRSVMSSNDFLALGWLPSHEHLSHHDLLDGIWAPLAPHAQDSGAGSRCGDIIVALSAAVSCDDLMDVACLVANAQQTDNLHVLYGIEIPRRRAVDDDDTAEHQTASRVLLHARQVALAHHIHLDVELVQTRDWGSALVSIVDHLNGGLLIIGAPPADSDDPYLVTEAAISGERAAQAADYVLHHARCEVWIERLPAPALSVVPA